MIQERLRLVGLGVLVFLVVPYIVLRQIDKAEKARESRQGKTVLVHYWGIPAVAQNLEEQIGIAVYRRFLDKPENKDVIIDKFTGLQIKELPASWDAMMQMAFAADRAPDLCELVTENIQTHRDERFIRPLPDSFTFTYSNATYDDDAGYAPSAVDAFRQERRRQEARFAAAWEQARTDNTPDGRWLPAAALQFDLAMMRRAQRMADTARPGAEPHLAEMLDIWNDLMRRSGQKQLATTAPDAELTAEPLTADAAWHRWLFEKTQAKIPADLLRTLYDLKTGKLYGADMGEASLACMQYRIRPFRDANLVDRGGKPVLPQTWDELEFWATAISLMGEGAASDGRSGYKLGHGQLVPYPFPMYAYGAGGLIVVQNKQGAWSCALDSPGTIRAMGWLRKISLLKPIKVDLAIEDASGRPATFPLVLLYTRKPAILTVPDFYLRLPGEAKQVVIRRLTLTNDWRVLDGDKELFRFKSEADLIDRTKPEANRKSGQCSPFRLMDINDYNQIETQLWDEDRLAMRHKTARTLVVPKPDVEGQARHPDGPAWDLIVSDAELKGPASLATLQKDLARFDINVNLAVSEQEWGEISRFMTEAVAIKDPAERDRKKSSMPAPLARISKQLAGISMPVDLYYPQAGLRPARPDWADAADLNTDRSGRWCWVHAVSSDGRTIVTVDRRYLVERQEYEAWPGGPRFVQAPALAEGGRYAQFVCGLQVPAGQVAKRTTWRIQVAIIDMGMLALNQRMNDRTAEDRKRLDAAIRLISYLSSDEAERIMVEKNVENGLGLTLNPILLRKYGYDAIADQIPRDFEEAIRNIRRVGRAVPAISNYRGFQQFLAHLGDKILINHEDPASACREITSTVNHRFLSEPDHNVMVQRRKVAWIVFAIIVLALLTAAAWMGRQLIRGVSASAAKADVELGSVGQRPTWRTHLAAWLFLGPAIASIFVWSYVPLGWGSVMAFQDFHVIKPTSYVGLDNFIRIFVDEHFYLVLKNTFYFVFLSLGLGFLAPVVLALMLNEIPWAKIFYRTVFYLPAITSGLVVMLMWKRFYERDEGLLNTLLLKMNEFGPATVFLLKLLGILALPALVVMLYNLVLMDDIETKLGRFFAALLPVGATLWLGFQSPGAPLPAPHGIILPAAMASACGFAGIALLVAAYRAEHEFSARRIPWAAPAVVSIFAAGWFLRLALVASGHGIDPSPQLTWSHVAQFFVLMLPIMGAWPWLRRLFGHEHTPRETMYLVLRQQSGMGTPLTYSPLARRACLAAGALIVAASLASAFRAETPVSQAMHYLLGGSAGWMLQPCVLWPLLAGLIALIFLRRGPAAAAVVGLYLAIVLACGLLPARSPASLLAAGSFLMHRGGGWLFQAFAMEPLGWLKDPGLAMLCIILPGVWAGMGPGCLIYLAGLKGIPDDVYEAADLDGAGAFQKTWTITVPHLMALLIINFVGAFIGAFQASQNVLVMTAGGPSEATQVLGLEVWIDAFVLLKFGYATALAWILGLMLIGFTMYQISILKRVQFKTSGMK